MSLIIRDKPALHLQLLLSRQLPGLPLPLPLGTSHGAGAGVLGARTTEARWPQRSRPQSTGAKPVHGSVPVFLSGPGAVTFWWSGVAKQALRCHFSSSLVTVLWGESLPLWGSASSSVK